jgi:site-specific recombinase XerD
MATTINTVKARESLKPRHAPYFSKLGAGRHLGFRKITSSSIGVWLARHRDEESGKQFLRSLGTFEELPPTSRFEAARNAADEWFKHLGLGGKAEVVTVRMACERYVEHIRDDGRAKTAADMAARFRRWVYSDAKFAALPLPKLTQEKVTTWRRDLRKTPAPVGRSEANKETRERSESSVNRDSTALRAALNFAHDRGWVTTDMAWRVALRPTKNADGRRDAYLDREQRRALIKAAGAYLASFLTALSLVPLRPGALAALTVANFDRKLGVLAIGKDKAGHARRIALPEKTAAFFAALAKDKLPGAPLLMQDGGKAWNKDAWKWPVKDAAKAAGLADTVTAYSLRHSTITDLVSGGLDLLTVAQLSGTSVAMIEKHYGHLQSDRASAALEMLAL